MLNKLRQSFSQAGEIIKEQANTLGDSAKQKAYHLIEEWVKVLPKFENYGLEITSFALSVSINPTLEVEMKGSHEDFPLERLNEILEENKGIAPVNLVFNTVKTTYRLQQSAQCEMQDPLIIKIRIKLSPEINVFLGLPLII